MEIDLVETEICTITVNCKQGIEAITWELCKGKTALETTKFPTNLPMTSSGGGANLTLTNMVGESDYTIRVSIPHGEQCTTSPPKKDHIVHETLIEEYASNFRSC